MTHENRINYSCGSGLHPDVAAEATTHMMLAFNGERETDNWECYFRSKGVQLGEEPVAGLLAQFRRKET
jgi:hypothetical protein